jgi:hypothetical protein
MSVGQVPLKEPDGLPAVLPPKNSHECRVEYRCPDCDRELATYGYQHLCVDDELSCRWRPVYVVR